MPKKIDKEKEKKIKPIEKILNEDNDNEWLNANIKNTESDELVKAISVTLELNEYEFPRLFELDSEQLPDAIKKIMVFGYESYYPDPENNTTNMLPLILNKLNDNTKIETLDALINKLSGISNNSKKIGIFGENYINELISKNFIGMSYQKTGEIDHSGDGLLTLNNGGEILVEIKNYATIINDDEINKFTFDMKYTKRKFGLFISINSKINKTKIIDLKTFTCENETYYQFFISNLSEDLHRLEVGILLLQLLSEYKNPKNKEIIITEEIKEKISNLIDQVNENEKLRGFFLESEKEIRNTLNNFYQKLRDNHMDMENKIKNIFNFLQDNSVTNLPDTSTLKENELLEKHKNTKIYNILKKTFDYLSINKIKFTNLEKEINIPTVGKIKILKDKIVLNTNSKLNITINDYNWDVFIKQFP
jgi:hypothetical protein